MNRPLVKTISPPGRSLGFVALAVMCAAIMGGMSESDKDGGAPRRAFLWAS